MGDDMPDFSLKLPNLTADISWSWRIKDSIEFDDIAFLPFGLSVGEEEDHFSDFSLERVIIKVV